VNDAVSDARIEVDAEVLTVHAVVLRGDERAAAFAEQARRYPGFAGCQRKTERIIPVIARTHRRTRRQHPVFPRLTSAR
jgi:hypothetical protein